MSDGTCPRCSEELETSATSVELADGERVQKSGVECPNCGYTNY